MVDLMLTSAHQNRPYYFIIISLSSGRFWAALTRTRAVMSLFLLCFISDRPQFEETVNSALFFHYIFYYLWRNWLLAADKRISPVAASWSCSSIFLFVLWGLFLRHNIKYNHRGPIMKEKLCWSKGLTLESLNRPIFFFSFLYCWGRLKRSSWSAHKPFHDSIVFWGQYAAFIFFFLMAPKINRI